MTHGHKTQTIKQKQYCNKFSKYFRNGPHQKNSLKVLQYCLLEKEMAAHSSILAWRILWMEEPGGLPSMGSHRVRHDWGDLACMHALEKAMATHSSILAWRIPGTGEPGGLPSMGSHRVGHDWSDLAAAVLSLGCRAAEALSASLGAGVSTSWLLLSQQKLEDASWLGKC